MDPLAWPEIRHLEVHGACVHWNGVGFSSLRVLELSIWTEGTVDNSVTSFFRDVASQPESYPSLEKIILPELPEWDTLVIMLERRNLLTGPCVNQISDIQFPFPIPAQLSCLVHDLLAGKWPTRPSHFELSLAGNVDIIMDLSLLLYVPSGIASVRCTCEGKLDFELLRC
ncbi:hypothetical protein CPB86DRAFT_49309 [Serendipita vermifera]|nr:hypothetical protein CPB86DRAFT_49309 [Serendipita vermifera]